MPSRLFFTTLALSAVLAGQGFSAEPTPLADAVQSGDRARIQPLLVPGAQLDARQVDGMTALHWAVQREDLDTTRALLKAGARATVTNRYGVGPLSLACANGNREIVEALLDAGADPNAALRGGETPLMTASRTGRPGAVQALLARGARVDAREQRGQTALMWAAAEGHAPVVDLLLQAGADYRLTLEDSGFTALFFAVREGRIDATLSLLRAGADLQGTMQPRKPSGKGPRPGTSPLLLAVENGHFELATVLLESGADPNDQRSGFTALHTLTWVRKPNRGDGDDGDPPPIGSGRVSSLQLARRLVARGADVNARLKSGSSGRGVLSRRGATPFLLAAMTADLAYLKVLRELGADPHQANADNCPPLLAAAGIGCLAPSEEAGTEPEVLETLQYLLSLQADVNAVDARGETAMHGAAYKSLPQVVQFLAAHGARLDLWNRTNQFGWTPTMIAEGYRVGNFKPSAETLAALHAVFKAAGVLPPPPTPRPATLGTGLYQPPPPPKKPAATPP